ncbi:hypothetical protein CEUSTIGMA_g5645.t1 [Chlamydomonas eustigma]|uniref:RRM domain-containing protein n=1 Tax=Chlamydomonas eustigma TaxID=1157962 RepID=A0A250X553_9CHLO|nr:hypothetical protein CEUSTIGMA_g5645.t1 [Chlamydomonas eustigma]|eukprot:GAX78203.1 hypothetical protein CEUSTIGMA_g5645.t1 [Chlamydomonas eustigma]
MSDRPERPIFCGNFEYDAEEREVLRLFERFGRVDRIDMKTGFAFVYMCDKRDADDAIRKLDDYEFGQKRRRLKVQWAKQSENDRKRELKPSTTLFVVNFDSQRVRERDLERYFEYYGRITRVEIKRNYAFVQFDDIKDAQKAMEGTNGKQFMGRTITSEYVQNENPFSRSTGGGGGGGGRSRSRSPVRRGGRSPSPRRRSPSPAPRRRSPSLRRGRSISPPPRRVERSLSPPPRRADRSMSPPPRRGRDSRSRSP